MAKAGPNVRQRRVARTLRRWRKARDRTQESVAGALNWPHTRLSRYESASSNAGVAEIIAIATILGIPEKERDATVNLAVAASDNEDWWLAYGPEAVRGDFADYIETEAEADSVRNAEAILIPGLLQTADYATALIRSWLHDEPDEALVEERSRIRHKRQARLTDSTPLQLHAIVQESALMQRVGGTVTMAEQLDHLMTMADRPNVVLQVLPVEIGAYPGFGTSYHIVSFTEGDAAAVYLENLNSGLYVEDDDDIKTYTVNFERLSQMALSPEASAEQIAQIRTGLAVDKE